jgi:hypothetical protein
MGQAKPAADQAAARKDILNLLGSSARGHVKILGHFPEQQVANASADKKCFEACILQVTNDFNRVRAEFSQPNSVLGLGNGEIIINIGLRAVTG